MNVHDDDDMLDCWYKCVHCILDQTNYYALFTIVLLTLNWKYSEISYLILLLFSMDCLQKFTFNKLRVAFNSASACMLTLVFKILKQLLESLLLDLYNDWQKALILLLWL